MDLRRVFRVVVIGVSLWALPACPAVLLERQEIVAIRDGDEDSLSLELTYDGIYAGMTQKIELSEFRFVIGDPELDLEGSASFVHDVAMGKRVFFLLTYLLPVHVDELVIQWGSSELELDKRIAKFLDGISIAEARVQVDESERFCAYQRIEIENISEGVALLNLAMRRELLAAERKGKLQEPGGLLDEATLAVALRDARSGFDWIGWTGSGIELSIPTSPELTARVIRNGLAAIAEASLPRGAEDVAGWNGVAAWGAELTRSLSSVDIVDNHIELSFRPSADGRHRLEFREGSGEQEEGTYASDLLDHLLAEGAEFPIFWPQ